MDPERVRAVQQGLAGSESEGQRRIRALHGSGTSDQLGVYPALRLPGRDGAGERVGDDPAA